MLKRDASGIDEGLLIVLTAPLLCISGAAGGVLLVFRKRPPPPAPAQPSGSIQAAWEIRVPHGRGQIYVLKDLCREFVQDGPFSAGSEPLQILLGNKTFLKGPGS